MSGDSTGDSVTWKVIFKGSFGSDCRHSDLGLCMVYNSGDSRTTFPRGQALRNG